MYSNFVKFSILFGVFALLVVCDASYEFSDSEETIDIDCSNGTYHPHELFCDWYYECRNGKPIPVRCPTGLHFSVELKSCVLPEFANCTVSILISLSIKTDVY